jgi:hypothetical protein
MKRTSGEAAGEGAMAVKSGTPGKSVATGVPIRKAFLKHLVLAAAATPGRRRNSNPSNKSRVPPIQEEQPPREEYTEAASSSE